MQFASRALVMDAFTASGINRRDVGLTIMNDEEVYPINYYLGVFNGVGPWSTGSLNLTAKRRRWGVRAAPPEAIPFRHRQGVRRIRVT